MTAIKLSIEMCVGGFWNFCISDLNPRPFSGFFPTIPVQDVQHLMLTFGNIIQLQTFVEVNMSLY
jgi:hypothetical protein